MLPVNEMIPLATGVPSLSREALLLFQRVRRRERGGRG